MNFLTDNKRLLKEDNTNKYLDRLRQQYKEYYSTKYSREKEVSYNAMRVFCLDCELVSFNEVELMEFEVNQFFTS
jgi:hypothetical protein